MQQDVQGHDLSEFLIHSVVTFAVLFILTATAVSLLDARKVVGRICINELAGLYSKQSFLSSDVIATLLQSFMTLWPNPCWFVDIPVILYECFLKGFLSLPRSWGTMQWVVVERRSWSLLRCLCLRFSFFKIFGLLMRHISSIHCACLKYCFLQQKLNRIIAVFREVMSVFYH